MENIKSVEEWFISAGIIGEQLHNIVTKLNNNDKFNYENFKKIIINYRFTILSKLNRLKFDGKYLCFESYMSMIMIKGDLDIVLIENLKYIIEYAKINQIDKKSLDKAIDYINCHHYIIKFLDYYRKK